MSQDQEVSDFTKKTRGELAALAAVTALSTPAIGNTAPVTSDSNLVGKTRIEVPCEPVKPLPVLKAKPKPVAKPKAAVDTINGEVKPFFKKRIIKNPVRVTNKPVDITCFVDKGMTEIPYSEPLESIPMIGMPQIPGVPNVPEISLANTECKDRSFVTDEYGKIEYDKKTFIPETKCEPPSHLNSILPPRKGEITPIRTVPEPGALGLVGVGLGAAALAGRRRRSSYVTNITDEKSPENTSHTRER